MAPSIGAIGALEAAGGTGPITPAYPAGISDGDLAVAHVIGRVDPTTVSCATAGWTQRAQEDTFAETDDELNVVIFTHPYTTGDPEPEFSISGGTISNNGVFAVITSVENYDTSTPLDVTPTSAAGNSQTMTAPSITTVTADTLLMQFFVSSNDVVHSTPSNGTTLQYNYLSTAGAQMAASMVSKTLASAGASGATDLVQATSSRYHWVAISVAFRPAATGGQTISPTGIESAEAFGPQAKIRGDRVRLYLSNTTPDILPADPGPTWDDTTSTVVRQFSYSPAGASATVSRSETSTDPAHDVLLAKWVSPPLLTSGNLNGLYSITFGRVQSSTAADFLTRLNFFIVSGDGLTQRTPTSVRVGSEEWSTTASGMEINGTAAAEDIAFVAGDRLVFELGYRATNADAASYSGTINYGGTSTPDLSQGSANVTSEPGWLELYGLDIVGALTANATLSPGGIASAEAFGSATVAYGAIPVLPTGIPSDEAFGAAVVGYGGELLGPDGIASAEAFGAVTVTPGTATVAPTGIASQEALGSPTVTPGTATIAPTGIASAEVLGSPGVGSGFIDPVGIESAEAFGTLALLYWQDLAPTGIASAEAFGVPDLFYRVRPRSIPSAEAFGIPRAARGRWRLVNPGRVDSYRIDRGVDVTYIKNEVGFTVYGSDAGLQVEETPIADVLSASQYVWQGGHDNITDDPAIRDLWISNGFEVEMSYSGV